MIRRFPILFLLVAVLSGAEGLAAQEDCEWLAPTTNFSRQTMGASVIVRVTDAHLRCDDGTRIRADSARLFENEEYYQLFGSVRYETPEQQLTAQEVRFWRGQGQLEARRDVTLLRISDQTRVSGEELDYLQASPTRPDDLLEVTGGRPHATFYPAGQEGLGAEGEPDEEPFELDADRILVQGRNRLNATGDVEVHRDSLDAYAQRLEYNTSTGELVLRSEARMVTPGYELDADTIQASMEEGEVRDLVAIQRAILTGEDLRLAAPRIRLFLPEGALERLVAVRDTTSPPGTAQGVPEEPVEAAPEEVLVMEHPPRPVARAEDFIMVADSLDVEAPGEVLERIVAVGRARGESTARDSLNTASTPDVARRDWIDGDTIIATFTPTPADTAVTEQAQETMGRDEYRLERLVARVGARSLYRLEPSDTSAAAGEGEEGPPERLALHYVTGDQITLILDQGEIDRMEVVGQTRGFHLEPQAGGRPPALDTATAPPAGEVADTAEVRPDTVLPPDTAGTTAAPGAGVAAMEGGSVSPSGVGAVSRAVVPNELNDVHVEGCVSGGGNAQEPARLSRRTEERRR